MAGLIYKYNKLKGRIIEKYGKQSAFAEAMEYSERTLSLKLNSKVCFNQNDIIKAIELLEIPEDEIQLYFFTLEVQRA